MNANALTVSVDRRRLDGQRAGVGGDRTAFGRGHEVIVIVPRLGKGAPPQSLAHSWADDEQSAEFVQGNGSSEEEPHHTSLVFPRRPTRRALFPQPMTLPLADCLRLSPPPPCGSSCKHRLFRHLHPPYAATCACRWCQRDLSAAARHLFVAQPRQPAKSKSELCARRRRDSLPARRRRPWLGPGTPPRAKSSFLLLHT